MREKDRDAYNFYKEELQKNGYISAYGQKWYSWFSEAIKKDIPEAICIDLTAAGMLQYIVVRRSILYELEKIAMERIARKQSEIDALVNAVSVLRREENR